MNVMGERYHFVIDEETENQRVDSAVTKLVNGLTRSSVQKLIDGGNITVNHHAINKNYKLKLDDALVIVVPEAKPMEAAAENIPIEIIYEDCDLLVVNKPKGMVVHPANGNWDGTLVNALLYHCGNSLSGINGVIRPGIVHRIDKDTSGLLMVAKNDAAHLGLAQQIKDHSFTREYETIVYGNVREDKGTICQPIGRNPKDRKKMAVTMKNSKPATTHFEVIKRYGDFTHLRCRLETGRTHQIRVHMAYIGHPVAGDSVYGPKKVITSLKGQCLHAKKIGFVHPIKNEYMEFSSDLPDYFKSFLKKLDNK